MTPAVSPARDFFERLAGLPLAAPANAAFERLFAPPTSPRAAELAADLHRALIGQLLEWLGLRRSAGGLHWEWRPLLRLAAEADPFYFTEQQLARRLSECPPLSPEQRAVLMQALNGFLALRRGGLLDRVTALVPEPLQQQWVTLFPAEYAWRSLDILRSVGLYPLGSLAGWRSFRRFAAGEFDAPATPQALRAWQELCWDAGGKEPSAAHRADFLAAALGGELSAAGLAGPCGAVPQCDQCALRAQCGWAAAEEPGRAPGGAKARAVDGSSAAARARLGQLEAVSLEHLLDGLFGFSPDERERLGRRLKGTSLRSLAAKSAVELEEWLAGPSGTPGETLSAEKLLLLFEVCRRFGEERLEPGAAFGHAQDVFQHFRMRFRDLKQERFLVVLLDIKKRYLSDSLITQGGLDSSPVHPREVFAAAVRERAAFVLLVHNHPSGDPAPSKDDLATTRDLAVLGRLMGIPVLDHVILGEERYVSIRESGLVEL